MTPLLLVYVQFLFQPNTVNKMQVISYKSRILTTEKQKFSADDRELCARTLALSQYEFFIIGSKFPINVFTDHLLFCFSLYSERKLHAKTI